MIRQAFREEDMSHTQTVQTHQDQKKAGQVKSKAKSMFIIFFDIKGIVHKEFILAGQTLNCDILRRLHGNCEDFSPNFVTRELADAS
jgi:hypothetical protein